MDIPVQSTLGCDGFKLSTNDFHFIRACTVLFDGDNFSVNAADFHFCRSLDIVLDVENFKVQASLSTIRASSAILDTDGFSVDASFRTGYAVESILDVDFFSHYALPVVERALANSIQGDLFNCAGDTKISHALANLIQSDSFNNELRYLTLAQMPLPPVAEITILSPGRQIPLKRSQIIQGSSVTLNLWLRGERLGDLEFVFTATLYYSNGQKTNTVIQKTSANRRSEKYHNAEPRGIVLGTIAKVFASDGTSEEVSAQIRFMPQDTMQMPKQQTLVAYELWAYDSLGADMPLESGTFTVVSASNLS